MEITLKVAPEKLKAQALSIETLIGEIEKSFGEIEDTVSRTGGYWNGNAANKARSEFEAQKEDTASVVKNLKTHPKKLLEMAEIYDSGEESIAVRNEALSADIIA